MVVFEGVYDLHWIVAYAIRASALLGPEDIDAISSRYFCCVSDDSSWRALQGGLSAMGEKLRERGGGERVS